MSELSQLLLGPQTIGTGLGVIRELNALGVREESARFQSG
jgi:hypothetical protein